MEPWILALVLVPLLAILVHASQRQRTSNLPPSPWSIPVIGHLHHVAWASWGGAPPHHVFLSFAQKYGPIFYLQLGSMRAVIVSHPSTAREVLKDQDAHLADRPKLAVAKYILYNCQDIVFGNYTKEWMDMKKFLATEFLSARKPLETVAAVRKDEMAWFVLSLQNASQTGIPFRLRDYLDGLSYNLVTRIIMGKRYYGVSPQNKLDCESGVMFRRVIDDAVAFSVSGNIADFFPWLEWLDWRIPAMKQVHLAVDRFLQSVLDGRTGDIRHDFVGMARSRHIMNQDDKIKAVLLDVIGGGTETSSTSVEWTFAELLAHPELLVKAQVEVRSVVGPDRCVEESDIQRMPYLQAVVKESFRLHPPVSLLVPRFSTKDLKIGGYNVPTGTTVFVNIYAIGRDPNVWEDPLEFNPDRFFMNNELKAMKVLGHDFELLPFGSGRRRCPGLALGLSNVQLTIATLLHSFNWKTSQVVFDEGNGGTTSMKVPLQVLPTPRAHLGDIYSTHHCTDPIVLQQQTFSNHSKNSSRIISKASLHATAHCSKNTSKCRVLLAARCTVLPWKV